MNLSRIVRRASAGALLLLAAACGGHAPSSGAAAAPRAARASRRTAFSVITREEIDARAWSNVLELVSTLRPNWVRLRGADNLNDQSTQVQAYLDNTHLADVSALENLTPAGVQSIEWVDGITAAARWGLNHGQGAIVVHMRRQ